MWGWEVIFTLISDIFTVLCWTSFTLIYPLCVSIRSIERGSSSSNQQCLAYWVLFALIAMFEPIIVKLLKWLPFWPYAKGVATLLLVTPYFGGASFIYKRFFRPTFIDNSPILSILLKSRQKGCITGQNGGIDAVAAADGNSLKNGPGLENPVVCQEKCNPILDNTEANEPCPSSVDKVQKEWSCVLCLVSTTSEKCLNTHFGGKKHKTKLEELAKKMTGKYVLIANKKDRRVFLRNLAGIARINLERWSGLLDPVTRSIRFCRWKKPDIGCTKLNTDGSVYRDNAGFGGLLRNCKGDPLCAFVCKAPHDDIFLVELWAIWRGLVLALGLGIKVIWVESDSMAVVKTINREQQCGAKAVRSLKHIWKLLAKFEKYRVTHSWRETNKAADYIARMSLGGSDVVLWPVDFPDRLHKFIKDDAQGKIYFRW